MRIFFMVAACVAILACIGKGQVRQEPRVYSAFIKRGPIVTGTITAIQPSAPDSGSGTLTVDITGELRGHLQKTNIELPYSTVVNPKYPPYAWGRVPPVAGHRVLLFLREDQDRLSADEVLDLDRGDNKWVPKIQAMLALEGQSGDRKALLDALSGSDQDLRSLAAEILLVRVCGPADPCRLQSLEALAALARDRAQPKRDRVWAISLMAHSAFLGLPTSAASDRAALTALAELLTEPEVAVRDEVVQDLHGLLLGAGVTRPVVGIPAADRTKVIEQLRRDAQAGVAFSLQARELSEFLARP